MLEEQDTGFHPSGRIAAYAGSFDPPTNGHVHVLTTAARLFDFLYVLVAKNATKREYASVKTRVKILECVIEQAKLDNVKVRVVDGEFVARHAADLGCGFLVRGIRGAADLEAETTIGHVNALAAPEVDTLVILSPKRLEDVSSSTVRGLVGLLGWRGVVRPMVPRATMMILEMLRATELAGDKLFGIGGEDRMTNVLGCYNEVGRAYHTIGHIVDCIEWLKVAHDQGGLKLSYYEYRQLAEALWFHDAIYNPKAPAGQNENESAILVGDPETAHLIRATALHFDPTFEPDDPQTQLMLDVDLASFAASDDEQDYISSAIRAEYKHVPLAEYCSARAKLLRGLLDKPAIYRTEFFRKRLEKKARRNIECEIEKLESA
jgi:pantetheine-phosphate adenylyltransferase